MKYITLLLALTAHTLLIPVITSCGNLETAQDEGVKGNGDGKSDDGSGAKSDHDSDSKSDDSGS